MIYVCLPSTLMKFSCKTLLVWFCNCGKDRWVRCEWFLFIHLDRSARHNSVLWWLTYLTNLRKFLSEICFMNSGCGYIFCQIHLIPIFRIIWMRPDMHNATVSCVLESVVSELGSSFTVVLHCLGTWLTKFRHTVGLFLSLLNFF